MKEKYPALFSKKNQKQPKLTDFKGYRPHPGQLKIHYAINNSKDKFFVIANGRQWGKTLMCINQCLYWAINDPKSTIYYVTPTFKLARKVYNELLNAIYESGVLKSVNKTHLSITFQNGSSISFHSGERPDALRGTTISYLIIDEKSFCKQELWEKVLRPALLVKGKKVIFISTPNGKNHFYHDFMKGKSGVKGYQSFTAPSTDNPYLPPDELEEAKQISELIYRVEYLAEFVDDSISVFRNIPDAVYGQLGLLQPDKKRKYFMGVDLGQKGDYTVVTVLDENKTVVDLFRIRYTNWQFIIKCIKECYFKWNIVNGFVETNFNGMVYEQLVNDEKCKNLRPLHTSPSNKNPIVEDLMFEFEKRKIRIPEVDYLINELEVYTFRYNRDSNRVTYSAPSGLHDDSVSSLMFALHAYKDRNPNRPKMVWSKI